MALLISLVILLYISTTSALFFEFLRKRRSLFFKVIPWLLVAALLSHAFLLSNQIIGGVTFNIGAMKLLSLTSLIMLIIALPTYPKHPYSLLALSLFAILSVFLSLTDSSLMLEKQNPMLGIHILLSILAYAILLLAALQALFVFLRDRALKNQSPIFLKRLPPMLRMEAWLFKLLIIGFIFLTLSLLTSLFFYDTLFDHSQIHKTVLSTLAWFFYGGILLARLRYKIRGKRAAKLVLLASLFLLLGATVARVIQEVIFHYR